MVKANTPKPGKAVGIEMTDEETGEAAMARAMVQPSLRHACALANLAKPILGASDTIPQPELDDYVRAMRAQEKQAVEGSLTTASRMLVAQAATLDAMFTETLRRSTANMGEHLGAMEIYARIALKAQAQSRATLEALAKLHQPREQTVRHVHVNEGGQAVIADQFHHHGGGTENGRTDIQSHATRPAGSRPSLLGADPFENGVPIPGGEGAEQMPDARRHKSGRS